MKVKRIVANVATQDPSLAKSFYECMLGLAAMRLPAEPVVGGRLLGCYWFSFGADCARVDCQRGQSAP